MISVHVPDLQAKPLCKQHIQIDPMRHLGTVGGCGMGRKNRALAGCDINQLLAVQWMFVRHVCL